jgi:hypothetical protein
MLELNEVVFFGRSWEESIAMYALDEADLSKRTILDCHGGPGGLVGGAIKRGYDITAVDPI